MTDEEKQFALKVNVDKAKNKTVAPMLLMILSSLTYVPALIFGEFDFGIVFEIASLIFLIIARSYMNKYDEVRAKRYVICSIISIGVIMFYDLILMITSVTSAIDVATLGFDYYFWEILSIAYISVLFAIIRDLSKANNPEKYKESTDWFYEKPEENDKKDRNIF